jgi:murein endopeptidase
MGWRPGEIWLDTDLPWSREPPDVGAALAANAPSFSGLTPEALATPVSNGLARSRWRRAELRRRQAARKVRAAALVIGPTIALTLASPRPGTARGGEALQESSRSQTLRPDDPTLEAAATARPRPARAKSTASSFPAVHWHRARSAGLPYGGSLSSGTQLPVEGEDWVTWNPVSDHVPNEPYRLYGHERTIRAILAVAADYRAANPDARRIVVGDISFRHGGPMELHRSHQNGLDVDVYYPRHDRRLRAPRTTSQVDQKLAQELVDRFLAAGAVKIFVGYSMGLAGPRDVVIPYPNHEDHMHVRFGP